jgi:hypothetical protein
MKPIMCQAASHAMRKIVLIVLGVVIVGALVAVGAFIAPILYWTMKDGFQSARQKKTLQSRSDYPQIATACVTIARSVTNQTLFIKPTDPVVPPFLRSLPWRYITANSNYVTMEFHGGFDHYGYRVRQSGTNSALWTFSWYTENGERLLTTISP